MLAWRYAREVSLHLPTPGRPLLPAARHLCIGHSPRGPPAPASPSPPVQPQTPGTSVFASVQDQEPWRVRCKVALPDPRRRRRLLPPAHRSRFADMCRRCSGLRAAGPSTQWQQAPAGREHPFQRPGEETRPGEPRSSRPVAVSRRELLQGLLSDPQQAPPHRCRPAPAAHAPGLCRWCIDPWRLAGAAKWPASPRAARRSPHSITVSSFTGRTPSAGRSARGQLRIPPVLSRRPQHPPPGQPTSAEKKSRVQRPARRV